RAAPSEGGPGACLSMQCDDLALAIALVLQLAAVGQALRRQQALVVVAVARGAGDKGAVVEPEGDCLARHASELVVSVALILLGIADLEESRALVHIAHRLRFAGLAGN